MTSTPFFAPRPGLAPRQDWVPPLPQHFTLSTGLPVRFVQTPGKPMASVRLMLAMSAAAEPQGAEGLALLTLQSMLEGAQGYAGLEFIEAIDGLGAQLDGKVEESSAELTMDVPVAHLEQALALMTAALVEPRFDEQDIALLIANRVEELLLGLSDPSSLVGRVLCENYFPEGHRLQQDVKGTPESLSAMTAEDVRRYHSEQVSPRGAELIVAADLAEQDLTALLEQTLARWTSEMTPSPPRLPTAQPGGPVLVVVDHPGSVQAHMGIAAPSVTRQDPAYTATRVAAHSLGGTTESILGTRLREEKGFTYGVQAGLDASRASSMFYVAAAFDSPNLVEAVHDTLELLRRAVTEGIPAARARQAVAELLIAQPLAMQTPSQRAEEQASAVRYGLPADHTRGARGALQAIDPEQVGLVFAQNVDLDRLVVVIVGDAESMAGSLTDLGLGEPVIISGPLGDEQLTGAFAAPSPRSDPHTLKEAAHMSTIEFKNDKASLDQAINGPLPVLVDFVAEWCGPCKAMAPMLEKLAPEVADRFTIVKVDVDVNEGIMEEYGIQGVPTLILFEDGEVLVSLMGMRTKQDLMAEIEPYL